MSWEGARHLFHRVREQVIRSDGEVRNGAEDHRFGARSQTKELLQLLFMAVLATFLV